MPNLTVDPQSDPLIPNDNISVDPSAHNFPKSILVGILIFVLLSATAYGAYWYGQSVMSTKSTPSASSFSNVQTPRAAPAPVDETSNWISYNGGQSAQYSFKYPPGWKQQDTGEGCGPVWYASGTDKVWLTICGLDINSESTPENMAANSAVGTGKELVKRVAIILDRHAGVRQEFKYSTEGGGYEIGIYVGGIKGISTFPARNINGVVEKEHTESLTGTLSIYMYVLDQSQIETSKSVFDQILSTFKFINGNQETGWSTFSDKVLGVSLKYPKGWYVNSESSGSDYYLAIRNFISKEATSPLAKGEVMVTVTEGIRSSLNRSEKIRGITTIEKLKEKLLQTLVDGITVVNEENSVTNGLDVFTRTLHYKSSGENVEESYILGGNGKVLVITSTGDISMERIKLNQILPTFRFD